MAKRIAKGSAKQSKKPVVGVIMGSASDWETMSHSVNTLATMGITCEVKIVSAHRTPKLLVEYATSAQKRGLKVIIAGAGGAAHLPGMTASMTVLPVLGVPILSKALKGIDSLLSIAQMPAGIPVLTLAIGVPGAINAALSAASILGLSSEKIQTKLTSFRSKQTTKVLKSKLKAK